MDRLGQDGGTAPPALPAAMLLVAGPQARRAPPFELGGSGCRATFANRVDVAQAQATARRLART